MSHTAVHVEPYAPALAGAWDGFVRTSKNGTFLFARSYLEYHRDRFVDCSLLVRTAAGDRLLALLPANLRDDVVESHGGLTYGGLVYDEGMTAARMLEVLAAVVAYLQNRGARTLRYRAVPHIYHRLPAEEDLYALFESGARLVHRAPLSVIDQRLAARPQQRRLRGLRRATASQVTCRESGDLAGYWSLLGRVLAETYDARPVHTLDEIAALQRRFPQHIRLFACHQAERLVAGVLVYEEEHVARAQYTAADEEGKRLHALDLLFHYLRHEVYPHKRYLDLGTSEAITSHGLNLGVIEYKESLGARLVAQDTYELSLHA